MVEALQRPNPRQAAEAQATLDKALDFLKAKQQADGSWQTDKDFPALTAVVCSPKEAHDEAVETGPDWLGSCAR